MTLLVEDDPGVRRVVRCMLQHIGYDVREAADGRQALETLMLEEPPDVILLDIILPDVNGLQMLANLKPTGVPVVTMTGSSLPDAVMRQKGARGILRKPFSMRQLRRAIETATKEH